MRTLGSGLASALEALVWPEQLSRAVRVLAYGLLAALIGVLLLIATATVPVLFGYHTYVVNSGSMEPSLEAGSIAVTHPTSPLALDVGDIIAWQASDTSAPILHRITRITEGANGQREFITQGDQNLAADPDPVALAGPGDKVIYSVPYAGYAVNFARSGLGMALLIGVPLVGLAALFLRNAPGSPRQERGMGTEVAAAGGQASPALYLVSAVDPRPAARSPSAEPASRDLPAFLVRQLRLYRGEDLAGITALPQGGRAAA